MASYGPQGLRRSRILVLLLPLSATFALFTLLLRHQRETSNPSITLEKLRQSGQIVELAKWGVQFQDCDPSQRSSSSNSRIPCRYLSAGQETLLLPGPSSLSELLAGPYRGANTINAEHTFSDDERKWLERKGKNVISFVIPHSVQIATAVVIGSSRFVTFGSGVHIHVQARASDLLASGGVRLESDVRGLPWFGPPELAPAFMDPSTVAEYTSLRERQIGSANIANVIHIGFPLLVAAVAVVLDHSLAMFLLSLVGMTQAARSFLSHLVNYGLLGGLEAKALVLVSNGLAGSCLIILAIELASLRHITNTQRYLIAGAGMLLALALLPFDEAVLLKADVIFDGSAALISVMIIAQGALQLYAQHASKKGGETPTESEVVATELPLKLFKLTITAAGLLIYAAANARDLIAARDVGFKDFLDWQHLILLPTLIAACLVDVGSTSRKMFSFARDMVRKAILERELELGREVQQKMLPQPRSSACGFAWRSVYLPASALAGDWYDIREIVFRDGKSVLVACLADVTGHGAGAALSTGVISAQWGLWCQWAADRDGPLLPVEREELLRAAPQQINTGLLALRSNENCTAIFLMLDASQEGLTLCAAGHPGALLSNGQKLEYLTSRGDRLGVGTSTEPWAAQSVGLAPGSYVVIFSDGLVPAGKTLSSWVSGLMRQQRKEAGPSLPLLLANQVRENRRSFRRTVRIEDDITLLAIGYADAAVTSPRHAGQSKVPGESAASA